MADDNLNVPVIVQATRIDATLLPKIFSQPYFLYVVQQGTDLGNVAGKANEAGQGAWDAQVKNDEQDLVLADHEVRIEAAEATLINHEQRITAAEATLVNHEERITAAEAELVDHEARITANEAELADHEIRITQNTTNISGLTVRMVTAESNITGLQTNVATLTTRVTTAEGNITTLQTNVTALQTQVTAHGTRLTALEYKTTRKKSELTFTGLTLNIPTTTTNLVTLLKALTPASGTFTPFFDTTADKMVVFNENKTVNFKLSIIGTWAGGATNRSMQLTFSAAVPDTLVVSRNAATATDNILMATFFSVDQGGFLATNGSTMTIQSNGSAFTATTIKMIAEQ
ncbi:tail needle knob protein [Serratia fonticola]|uniref:tail needle knob protein n=1 Tax=Serratia fonticola TaxID=47917 RepID=UPI0034C5D2C2